MQKIIECIDKARYTPRFSTYRLQSKDNVAEHSYTVTMFTLLLCKLLKGEGLVVDQGKALAFAVMHDFEETLMGDVISPTKAYMEEDYQFAAADQVHKVLGAFPGKESGSLYGSWRWAKYTSPESKLVIYADLLATQLVVGGGDPLGAESGLWCALEQAVNKLLAEEKNLVLKRAVEELRCGI